MDFQLIPCTLITTVISQFGRVVIGCVVLLSYIWLDVDVDAERQLKIGCSVARGIYIYIYIFFSSCTVTDRIMKNYK